METENLLTGRISNRKCPACGHHEVGYVTDDGVFHPLKPGITIKIVQGEPAPVDSSAGALATNADSMDTEQADQEELIAELACFVWWTRLEKSRKDAILDAWG